MERTAAETADIASHRKKIATKQIKDARGMSKLESSNGKKGKQ